MVSFLNANTGNANTGNSNTGNLLSLNRYRYSNGNVNKSKVKLDNNSNPNDGFIIVKDSRGQYPIQLEDFICNYGEPNQSFCYTHGHARDIPNENVDVYEIPQN